MPAPCHWTVGSPLSPPSTKHRSPILLGKPSSTRFPTRQPRVELLGLVAVSENWIELDPSHVCLGDKGHMTAGALGRRSFLCRFGIRKRVVAEVEEAPAIGRGESLAVFHSHVHAVVFTVEISSAGWFGARTIGEGGIQDAR